LILLEAWPGLRWIRQRDIGDLLLRHDWLVFFHGVVERRLSLRFVRFRFFPR
jgi:hypothetical protein